MVCISGSNEKSCLNTSNSLLFFLPGEAAGSNSKEGAAVATGKDKGIDILQKQETMFSSMERQYEMARIATHTHKGFGLGFTSQSFIPK